MAESEGGKAGEAGEAVIRPAIPSDLAAICALTEDLAALHHAAWPTIFAPASGGERDAAHWRDSIEGPNRVALVAEVDGVIVGFIALAVATETHSMLQPVRHARVNSVCVAAAMRGLGIGRALMAQAECWAQVQGASELRLVVWDFNRAAMQLYEDIGYQLRSHTLGKVLQAGLALAPQSGDSEQVRRSTP